MGTRRGQDSDSESHAVSTRGHCPEPQSHGLLSGDFDKGRMSLGRGPSGLLGCLGGDQRTSEELSVRHIKALTLELHIQSLRFS